MRLASPLSLVSLCLLATFAALPACGSSASEEQPSDTAGALTQSPQGHKLADYALVNGMIAVNEAADDISAKLKAAGAATVNGDIYAGITAREAQLSEAGDREYVYGVSCSKQSSSATMIESACIVSALVKTKGVKDMPGGVTITIEGKLAKAIATKLPAGADAQTKTVGPISCKTAGTDVACTVPVAGQAQVLDQIVDSDESASMVDKLIAAFF